MHILELPSFFPPYGGMFCVDQAKALAMQGNTVRIAACINMSARLSPGLYLKAPLGTYTTQVDGIEVMRKDLRGIPFFPKACAMHWVKAVEKLVDKYVEKFGKPDIIHAHCCQWAGYAAMLCGERYGVPYVVTEHLSSVLLKREYGRDIYEAWQLPMITEAYRRADLVVPVSAELVDDLAPFFGRDYKWVEVSNTIDTDFFKYKKRIPLDADRELVLCCIANFVPGKGYDVLFDAVGKYRKATGDRVRLLVAGRFTDSDEAKRLADECGVGDIVEFYGEVGKEKVIDILYRSDCMLLATRKEAQGLVVLEAMSTGLPVITTDCVPKSVRINSGCRIVPVDDAVAMARAIGDFRKEGTNACRLASEKVAGMASPDVVGKRLDSLFRNVVEMKK